VVHRIGGPGDPKTKNERSTIYVYFYVFTYLCIDVFKEAISVSTTRALQPSHGNNPNVYAP
jgi:hypothetical protein